MSVPGWEEIRPHPSNTAPAENEAAEEEMLKQLGAGYEGRWGDGGELVEDPHGH